MTKRYLIGAAAVAIVATGCSSDADKTSDNLSKAAEQFEVQRRVVGINGITDNPAFEVEGRCSIENEGRNLVVICKHGDDDYRKHFVGISDNTFYVITQLEPMPADEYRTRIIIKPENFVPDFDLS